ncbi:MAG: hypothetical protein ACM335_03700 [Deltaproteobacteria bacterium]
MFRRAKRPLQASFILSFFLLILLPGSACSAEAEQCVLPEDYGEVVCRYNERAPNHLYIIGLAHRDSLTRANGSRTPRIQAEVYKIGEWLIQNQEVELLLPEGFFATNPKRMPEKKGALLPAASRQEKMEILELKLSDDRRNVNAEMLLRDDFPLLLRQVEDRDLYQAALEDIRLLAETKGNMEKSYLLRSEIDYHQKMRVGTMLQRIPGIVDDEFRQGRIGNKKAVFTIGLSHVANIIKYLEEQKVTVLCPPFIPSKHEDYVCELNLAKEDFAITVIIPRTLINDRETMEKNNLKGF